MTDSTETQTTLTSIGGIGVDSSDVLAEHARLSALGGIDLDPAPMRMPGAPLLFMLRDPDGNSIAVVETPPARPLIRDAYRRRPRCAGR